MELKVKLEISNLYGGDGFTRPEEREQIKYKVKKVKEVEKYDDMRFDDKVETNKEIKIININSFKEDDKKNFTQRLGGSHGKLWGSMKAVGKFLIDCKNETLLNKGIKTLASIDRMMGAINVTPVYPKLDYDKGKIWVDTIPQKMAGPGNSMIFMEYDVIDKVTCELTLTFPEMYHDVILEVLKMQELVPTLNKRRSTVVVTNKEIFDKK